MNRRPIVTLALSAAFFLLPAAQTFAAKPAPPDRWVGTWAASPMAEPNKDGQIGGGDVTLREIVHVSMGGPLVRVVLTNEFGTEPLTVGAVHLAVSSGSGGAIGLMSANALTFGGKSSIVIPPGALAVSDPAALALPAFADVAVSLFLPAQAIHTLSQHGFADQTNYLSSGNQVGKASLSDAKPFYSWPFLKGLEVKVSAGSGAVVCFGDSITDGALSTRDANSRWPDLLARRMQGNGKTKNLGVLNQGIGGNRVLHEGTGPAALARFDHDVLAQAGVRYLVILEGINDLGVAASPNNPHDVVTADDLIQGYSQMAERAHTHGIKVYGATLTPYMGASYSSPAGEAIRQAVNQWIRTSNLLDGFIDFDKATRDPANPAVFAPSADSGDHLHPKDAGYKAMADSIDLKLFEPNKKETYDITREQ